MLSYALICQFLAIAAASVSSDCTLEATPRFLYMKKQIDPFVELPNKELSFSIAPTYIHNDLDEVINQGFHVAEKNKLQLSFNLSAVAESIMHISKSELWLFPYMMVEDAENNAVRLNVHVTAQSLTFKKKTRVTYDWDTQDDCMPLDITMLMKRLLKKKNTKDHAEIQLIIEISRIQESEHSGQENQQIKEACRATESRGCNTPFLVFKYPSSEQAMPDTPSLPDFVDLRPRPEAGEEYRKRRDVVQASESSGDRANETETAGCSWQPLWYNFSDLPLLVVDPKTANIGTCVGSCPSKITARSQLIALSGSLPQSCCFPSAYSSLSIILDINGVLSIVSLPDVIVTNCTCEVF